VVPFAVGGHKYIPIDVLRSKASVAFVDVVWQLTEYISLALSAMQRDADVKLLLPFLTTVEDEILTGSSLTKGMTISLSASPLATMGFNRLVLPRGLLAREEDGGGPGRDGRLCMPLALIM